MRPLRSVEARMQPPSKQRPLLLLAGMFLASLALRPQLVGIGPLLSTIQHGLGVPHSVAGLLSTVVVLCMGLFAPVAFLIARHAGPRWSIAGALALIAVFGVARALVRPAGAVIVLTVPVGIGIAIAGSLMPLVVTESWPERPVLATAVYTTGISLGAAVAAAAAVPLADALGSWRDSLTMFSLFTAALVVAWAGLSRGYGGPRASGPLGRGLAARSPSRLARSGGRRVIRLPRRFGPRPSHPAHEAAPLPRLPLRSRTGWLLVAIFALVSITYYGINAWLPSSFTERGWSHSSAGALLTVLNAVTVPVSVFLAFRGDLFGSRRFWLAAGATLQLAGLLGVILAPAGGWAWAALIGAGIGLLFPSMMLMPLDVADRPDDVGAMVALMLGAGYTLSAVGPFLLGLIRDRAGSFTLSMWLMFAVTATVLGIVLLSTHDRLRRHPRSRLAAEAPQSAAAVT